MASYKPSIFELAYKAYLFITYKVSKIRSLYGKSSGKELALRLLSKICSIKLTKLHSKYSTSGDLEGIQQFPTGYSFPLMLQPKIYNHHYQLLLLV